MLFLYGKWLGLSLPTRAEIARNFGITKVGATHVQDNRVVSDGYSIGDVERALNIDAIQKFLGTGETDMEKLFESMIARIEGREVVHVVPDVEIELPKAVSPLPEVVVKPKKEKREKKVVKKVTKKTK